MYINILYYIHIIIKNRLLRKVISNIFIEVDYSVIYYKNILNTKELNFQLSKMSKNKFNLTLPPVDTAAQSPLSVTPSFRTPSGTDVL